MDDNNKNKKPFVERILDDYVEGEYDDEGFFNTPNGSFWDPDGVYFNREGKDKHGGYYDENQEYVPGEGWDEVNNCYVDEYNDDYYDDEYGSDHDYMEDDGFGEIDMDNIQDEEKLLFKNMNDIEKITEDPSKVVVKEGDIKNNEEPKNEEEKKDEKEGEKKEENKEEKKEEKKEENKEQTKKKSNLMMLMEGIAAEKKEPKNKEKNNKDKKNDTKNNNKKSTKPNKKEKK